MRDCGSGDGDIIECCGVRIDRAQHRAYATGNELDLTPTEFRLLECMLEQPGRTFTREELINTAMGRDALVLARAIDAHVLALRKKLDTSKLIVTVRGAGYCFVSEGDR